MSTKTPVTGMKLVTGEDIISHARFNKTEGTWTLSYPGILVLMTSSSGNPSVGVADYLPFTEIKEITLQASSVIFTYLPDNEMVTGYVSRFDTSDNLPSKENIVPFTRK